MIPRIPTIAAPRGVFSPGALQLKRFKKQIYFLAARLSGLFTGLYWQASSTAEERNIWDTLPGLAKEKMFVVPDMAAAAQYGGKVGDYSEFDHTAAKEPGKVRFIYLSRIKPVKNLKYALTLLCSIEGHIKFDIFGPVQDLAYWDSCLEIIRSLPPHVQVHYHGPVRNEEVGKLFSDAHFLLLPTLGESFGHVILESLQAGCPVLISDRTPWNDLSEGEVGWIIPLENQGQWLAALQTCVDMDQEDFTNYSIKAGQCARRQISSPQVLQANRDMFLALTAENSDSAARRAQ